MLGRDKEGVKEDMHMRNEGDDKYGMTPRQEPELLRLWGRINQMVAERLKQREGTRGGRRAESTKVPRRGK